MLVTLPVQLNPFPVNPVLQEHVKLPAVLLQTAFVWQGEELHSLISIEKINK